MIYLDNAATSFPKPPSVIESVTQALSAISGTPGRGNHLSAMEAGDWVGNVRKAMAVFFGVNDPFRVIFTYSATDALNMAIKGFLNVGDRVIISPMEHNSVLRPLRGMEIRGEITLDIAACDSNGRIDLEDLEAKLKASPVKLVAINHASNVTGVIQDVFAISKLVRANGAYLLLDAAQTSGLININTEAMGVDMLACAGHKSLYATQGTGALVLGSRIKSLRPFREGGTGFNSKSELQPGNWPEAFESGTHNVPGIISLGAGLKFIHDIGVENIRKKEEELFTMIWEGLAEYDNIKIYSPNPDNLCLPLLSFNIDGWDAQDVGDVLSKNYNIYVRTGLHCAPIAHKMLGTFPEGTVRVSPGYFNTGQDIVSFLKTINAIASVKAAWY